MSSDLPTTTEAWRLLAGAGPPAWVLDHVSCVEALAVAMADRANEKGLTVDRHLVRVGAILHDFGRAQTQDPRHAHLGAEALRDLGLPDVLVHVVERHTGAGIDANDAAVIGVPAKDYTPQTLEERIVAHADNLWSGSRRLALADIEAKYRARGLGQAWEKIARMHASLCDELDVDLERLVPADPSRAAAGV